MKIVNIILDAITPVPNHVHVGKVITVAPIDLRVGLTVVTPDGIGEIRVIIPNWTTKVPEQIDVMLYRGFIKRYKPIVLQQYVVHHKPSDQFVLLSPANYRYIYCNNQPVEYTVTNRKYAQLTEDTKQAYAHIKTLNKMRGGPRFLNMLNKLNLEIKRKGE